MKAGDHLRLIIQQHPEETVAQHQARLAYRARNLNRPVRAARPAWHWILGAVLLAGIVLLLAVSSRAQTTNQNVNLARIGGTPQSGSTLNVNCLSGCSGAAGGGAAQLQVRNAGDSAWVNVGFNVANLTLPVTLQAGAATIGAISNTSFQVSNFPSTYDVSDRAARLVGHVTVDSAPTTAVTGTFWQATQPVSGTFWQATQPVSGTFWQATQPVSSSQLPAALDGSGFLKVHEQGTTTVSGSVSVSNFPATQLVSGTFFQATQPVSGTVTANQGTANATPWNENVAQFAGTNASTGTGASGAGIPRVTVSNDSQVRVLGNAGAIVDAANNAAAPANVIADGFEAQSSALGASATASNMRRGVVGLDGVLYVRLGSPLLFSCGLTAIAASLTQCQAVPSAGTSLYLTDISIMSDTATGGTYLLRYGTGSNCGTGTTTLFPAVASLTAGKLPYPANSATGSVFAQVNFQTPLKLPAANALCIICTATNTCTVSMQGFTAP